MKIKKYSSRWGAWYGSGLKKGEEEDKEMKKGELGAKTHLHSS